MTTDSRLTRVETKMDVVLKDTGEIRQDLRRLDTKIDAVKESVDKVKDSLGALAQRVAASDGVMIKWMIGTALGTATVVIAFLSLLFYVISRYG